MAFPCTTIMGTQNNTSSTNTDEIRDRIVRLCGEKPRVELFARQRAKGWVSLGDEIDGMDIRDAIGELSGYEGEEELTA